MNSCIKEWSFQRLFLIILESLWIVSPGSAQRKLTKIRIGIIPIAVDDFVYETARSCVRLQVGSVHEA